MERSGKLKILLLGHGRHGKDTVAGNLSIALGYNWCSSSKFAAEKAVYPLISNLYKDWQAAHLDRRNHRDLWFHAICAFNKRPGPSLVEQALVNHDIYVGMRSRIEFENSRPLFDLTIWVDRSKFVPDESATSMELRESDADITLNNNLPHSSF